MSARAEVSIVIIAADGSADALGGHLVAALASALPGARFGGIGGSKTKAAGLELWYPAEMLAPQGGVLRRLPEAVGKRRELVARLLDDPPDLFIGVDAVDFNLDLEERVHRRGIRTVHYVAPPIAAGQDQRLHRLKRAVDRVLALFPFEIPILEAAGVPATFVGHPLADLLPQTPDRQAARDQFRLSGSQTVVALLPGTEVSAVEYLAERFIRVAQLMLRQVRHIHFLVPLQSRQTRTAFERVLYRLDAQELPLTILFGHAHLAMTAADSVLVSSGTASLEAALLKRPMVVAYRSARGHGPIPRHAGEQPFVALPNRLAGRFVVPEICVDDASVETLAQAVLNQLHDKVARRRQEAVLAEVHRTLRQNTRERLVEAIVPLIDRSALPGPLRAAASTAGVAGA